MFASKQFFVDEQNMYLLWAFYYEQKENPNWFCEKGKKNFGENKKKGNQGSLYSFYTRPSKFNDLFMVSR